MSYSPEIGRWIEEDDAGYVDSMNLYQFEKSSPEQSLDPSGNASEKWGASAFLPYNGVPPIHKSEFSVTLSNGVMGTLVIKYNPAAGDVASTPGASVSFDFEPSNPNSNPTTCPIFQWKQYVHIAFDNPDAVSDKVKNSIEKQELDEHGGLGDINDSFGNPFKNDPFQSWTPDNGGKFIANPLEDTPTFMYSAPGVKMTKSFESHLYLGSDDTGLVVKWNLQGTVGIWRSAVVYGEVDY